jgi:geranylgeranyl pyrophosphate synthase
MHPSWEKIQENFKQQYGDRWEEVFWAWMNEHGYDETEPAEGQIKGEECKKEEEDVKKLNEEFKKESGEEMVIEYLEQLIKEMEEALDQLENALEKKRISELPTT